MLAEYELLGVNKNATREELTTAYRRAAMRWHPDRNPDNPKAKEHFQEIERAYRMLLKITPRVRLVQPDAAEEEQAADDVQAEIDKRARAVDAWRKAYEEEQRERRWHERRHARYERMRERKIAKYNTVTSGWLTAGCLMSAVTTQLLIITYPLNIVIFSAFIFTAILLCPPGGKTYTSIALSTAVNYGGKLYFIGLLVWLLWLMAAQIFHFG